MTRQQNTELTADSTALLTALEGRDCRHCVAGTLVRTQYKGNLAVCCPACETPQAQLW